MRNEMNLQDMVLNGARQQGQAVTVFLTNGFQMRGIIRGFDNFVVLLETEGKQQMIYKHAISTVIPQRSIEPSGKRELGAQTKLRQSEALWQEAENTLKKER